MKKPYLANYMQELVLNKEVESQMHYDDVKQISFVDAEMTTKVIDKCFNGYTVLTDSVEPSDDDEFYLRNSTRVTATIESKDVDEFYTAGSTRITRSIEASDLDEFLN